MTIAKIDFAKVKQIAETLGEDPVNILRACGVDPLGIMEQMQALFEKSPSSIATSEQDRVASPENELSEKKIQAMKRDTALISKLLSYVTELKVGEKVDSYSTYYRLTDGKSLETSGDKRAWTFIMKRCPAIEYVVGDEGYVADTPTVWGSSPQFRRVPLITDRRGTNVSVR